MSRATQLPVLAAGVCVLQQLILSEPNYCQVEIRLLFYCWLKAFDSAISCAAKQIYLVWKGILRLYLM